MATGRRRRQEQHLPPRAEIDLSDQEYDLIRPLIPASRPGGRPRRLDERELVNAVLYLAETGVSWRRLPGDFPPWPTVYWYYRRWEREGVWERIHATLARTGRRPQLDARRQRRAAHPARARGPAYA